MKTKKKAATTKQHEWAKKEDSIANKHIIILLRSCYYCCCWWWWWWLWYDTSDTAEFCWAKIEGNFDDIKINPNRWFIKSSIFAIKFEQISLNTTLKRAALISNGNRKSILQRWFNGRRYFWVWRKIQSNNEPIPSNSQNTQPYFFFMHDFPLLHIRQLSVHFSMAVKNGQQIAQWNNSLSWTEK